MHAYVLKIAHELRQVVEKWMRGGGGRYDLLHAKWKLLQTSWLNLDLGTQGSCSGFAIRMKGVRWCNVGWSRLRRTCRCHVAIRWVLKVVRGLGIDMPCSYGIFQYLIGYFCVVLNIFWYDFVLFLINWYLSSLFFFYVDEMVQL